MKQALLALAVLLLVQGASASQVVYAEKSMPIPIGPSGVYFELRPDSNMKDFGYVDVNFLVAGLDNVLNFTGRNDRDTWWNGSFDLNVTGATVTPARVTFKIAPFSGDYVHVVVHPEEANRVEVRALSPDGFIPGGEPAQAIFISTAVPAPSVRFLDPPPLVPTEDDDEFVRGSSYGGPTPIGTGFLRVRPGDYVTPRVEVKNVLDAPLPGMTLMLETPTGRQETVEVAPLEPRESRTIEFPEFRAGEQQGGGRYYGGPQRFHLMLRALHDVGGVKTTITPSSYEVRNGAVVNVVPAFAIVEAQDGIAVDLFLPKNPTLGVPTRLKYEITNHGSMPTAGRLNLRLDTPNGLHYEVQGPETRNVPVNLAPGAVEKGAIEFTPRVTGYWSTHRVFYSDTGQGYGWGNDGFVVKGPLSLSVDQQHVVYARIGEPVGVDVSITSSRALQDATLKIATRPPYSGGFGNEELSGDIRPGFTSSLVRASTESVSLGTLRPGGVVNASVEVVGRAAGRYTVTPYVLSDGFAYTHEDSMRGIGGRGTMYPPGYAPGGHMTSFELAVQNRALDVGWALMPFTLGLAVFVGTWTFRTRFVK